MPVCSECQTRVAANQRVCPKCNAPMDGSASGKGARSSKSRGGGKQAASSGAPIVPIVASLGGVLVVVALGWKFVLPAIQRVPDAGGANAPQAAPAAGDPAVTEKGAGQGTMAPVTGQTKAFLNPEEEFKSKQALAVRHLQQMGLSSQTFHEINEHLPPIATRTQPKAGDAGHSWMTDLLPYNDATRGLYNSINRQLPWTDAGNAAHFQTVVSNYLNPGADVGIKSAQGYGLAHFAANSKLISEEKAFSIREIPDGLSNTMLAGTVTDGFKPWGDPSNHRDPGRGFGGAADAFGAPHRGVALVLMADGSVRLVKQDLAADLCKKLAEPSDGQPLDPSFGTFP